MAPRDDQTTAKTARHRTGGGLGGSRGARKRLVSTSTSVWMFAPLVEVEEKGVGLAWRWSELGVQWGVF